MIFEMSVFVGCFSLNLFYIAFSYADDITLLAYTPAQTKSRLQSLEQAAGCIGLHVNPDKTEYMHFNQSGDISTLNVGSLKLVDKFTYLGSSISSTENDINTRLAKAWTAIDWLSVIWKSDLVDKMKRNFFQAAVFHSHLHEYGYVRNKHIMFMTIEHIKNIGISKFENT